MQQVGLLARAPNGSAPQMMCSSRKFVLARRFGKNNTSLKGKCSWEVDNSGCLKGVDVKSSSYVLYVNMSVTSSPTLSSPPPSH